MSKLISGFLIFGIIIIFVVGLMQGGGGVQAIQLTGNINASSTTFTVDNTTGFLLADIVTVDAEHMSYTNLDGTHLYNVTRGIDGTTPAVHKAGAYVYTEGASALNQGLGFNAASLAVSNGVFAAITIPTTFLFVSVPTMIISADGLFSGDLSILQYIFLAFGVGIYVVIALAIGTVIAYVLRP